MNVSAQRGSCFLSWERESEKVSEVKKMRGVEEEGRKMVGVKTRRERVKNSLSPRKTSKD